MSRRLSVGILVLVLAGVAIARWTIWVPGPTPPAQGATSHTEVLIGPRRPSYMPPSAATSPRPAVLRSGPGEGKAISLRVAAAIRDALWSERETAAASHDIPMLERLETGPALHADTALANAERAASDDTRAVRSFTPESVIVPAEHGYPIWFMARAHVAWPATDADPKTPLGFDDVLIISKASPRQSWKLAVDVTFDPTLMPSQPQLAAPQRPTPPPSSASANGELSELASYYQTWFTTRRSPAGQSFAPGPGTTGQGTRMASPEPGVILGRIALPQHNPAYAIPLANGYTLACGAINALGLASPTPGGYLYQPPDRSNWGDELPPGDYQRIRTYVERQLCIARAPRPGPMLVYGGEPTEGDVTGTPSPNPSTPSRPPTTPGAPAA